MFVITIKFKSTDFDNMLSVREIRQEHIDQASHVMECSFRDSAYTNYFYPDSGNFKIQVVYFIFIAFIARFVNMGFVGRL